ncbi:hypothetical protein PSCICN_04730 [Pseudomonas cichorii]|uniref:hypothetical protein n=1 Tax=Pseudomonas cichorii TaxID=36746 RepID=UPI001A08FE63|nr:hypothetical protein [Pseudomonas cichorii]GFM79781.1 hypothetical protein PSCICN_04730 [Pseudomonas cichorii]
MQAASRKAERKAQRRNRELQLRQKEYAKMEALEQAAYEVEVYENKIDLLLSVHKECGDEIDWQSFIDRVEPVEPVFDGVQEAQARDREQNYQPGFFARLFKLENRQRKKLQDNIEKGRLEDKRQHNNAVQLWQTDHAAWQEEYKIAQGILRGEGQAKLEAIKLLDPFSDISHLGTAVKFSVGDKGVVEANLSVHGSRVIPSDIKSLLQSGKLSTKKMPVGKYNELLQDYICSCVFRVGRELLSILPDDLVVVTAVDDAVNTATGHMEKFPIVSVAVSRKTIEALNMQSIDPSDAMKNFVHNMSFKKTSGFTPIQVLDINKFSA